MIVHRNYIYTDNLFEGDFLLVRDLLMKIDNPTFPVGWWDHQITRPSFCAEHLSQFGLWFKAGQLVAIACVEEELGTGIICVQNKNKSILGETIDYAKNNLHDQGALTLLIPDMDKAYQEAASKAGFIPTQERDTESIIQIDKERLHYTLPEGFRVVSMADHYDPVQYSRIMRRGFANNLEERTLSPADVAFIDRQFKRPFVNLDLQIAVIAPDASWAAFCGMWQAKESRAAFIEPVVTDPDYRKMGLGKAAVYEALCRCGKLGSASAIVLSTLQFYFNIGFRPNSTSTRWKINHTV